MPRSASQGHVAAAVILRRIALFSIIPALPILIAHGVSSGLAFPALGLLPLSASAFLSAYLLYRDTVSSLGSSIQALSVLNIFVIDFAIAFFQITFLIPSWVTLSWAWQKPLVALGAYGTVFMMYSL